MEQDKEPVLHCQRELTRPKLLTPIRRLHELVMLWETVDRRYTLLKRHPWRVMMSS